MWFRLAALFGCTVREAQARCNSREFAEWCAFYNLDPFGELRADYRAALMTVHIRRAFGDSKCKLTDCLLAIGATEKPKRDWQTQKVQMTAWAQSWNRQQAKRRKHGDGN